VETVKAHQAAQREARILVIEAERQAQQSLIGEKNKIELEALRRQRDAEARAVALKEMTTAEASAALKQAETLRTQAQAEVEAEKLRADGARAKASAAGLAEAEVQTAKAEAALREAEAIRAKGLAEAESAKAKAEALAAYDGVQQRVELTRLQLDAQVRIEVARAEALGTALASMNIKMIGDPAAAASLLRLVTMADGLGEVLNAAPAPVRAVGQQVINKLTGNPNGDGLLNLPAASTNGHDLDRANRIADLAGLVPGIMKLVEQRLDVNALTGQTVGQVLDTLLQKVDGEDRATVERARKAVSQLPLVNNLPCEEVYLRASVKA
jgi:uncharacterized membrane protein YqiK